GSAPPYAVTHEWGNDGRLLTTSIAVAGIATLSSSSTQLGYKTYYDSAGRVVRVGDGARVIWEAGQVSDTGSYDALGRLAHSSRDNGLVAVDQTFSKWSNLPTSRGVTLPGGTALYAIK